MAIKLFACCCLVITYLIFWGRRSIVNRGVQALAIIWVGQQWLGPRNIWDVQFLKTTFEVWTSALKWLLAATHGEEQCQCCNLFLTYTTSLSLSHFFVYMHVGGGMYAHRWRCGATGKAFGLAISRSRVQILLEATLRNNLRQVVYTYVPLSPSSITSYRPKGGDALRLGR